MTGLLLRGAALMLVYLLVLTSLAPGDIAVGALVGLAVAAALGRPDTRGAGGAWHVRVAAAAVVLGQTAVEVVRGSWRVVRFCLGATATPGFVEIPRDGRSRAGTALWGVLTGEAPDEVPVDVDEERGVLVVHLVHADDPDGVRARHRRLYERWQRKVVP